MICFLEETYILRGTFCTALESADTVMSLIQDSLVVLVLHALQPTEIHFLNGESVLKCVFAGLSQLSSRKSVCLFQFDPQESVTSASNEEISC